MAITWRNIDTPDLRGAGFLMQGAQESFNAGMDRFLKTIADTQQARANIVEGKRSANETDFRDYLQSFASPEALAEAKASGAIDARLASYGGVVDRNALRGASDERLNVLRTQANEAFAYENTKREQADRPVIAKYEAMTAGLDLSNPDVVGPMVARIREEVKADEAAGRISSEGATQVLKSIGDTAEASEDEVFSDRERAYTTARRSITDRRADDQFARDDAARIRAESADKAIGDMLATYDSLPLDQRPSVTDLRNKLQATMGEGDFTAAEIAAAGNSLDQMLAGRLQTSQADTLVADAAMSELRVRTGMEGNPFDPDRKVAPMQAAAEIVKELSGKDGVFSEMDTPAKQQAIEDIARIANQGIKFQTRSGEVEIDRIPPEIIAMAVQTSTGGWTSFERRPMELIKSFIDANPRLIEDYMAAEAYKVQRRELLDQTQSVGELARQRNMLVDSLKPVGQQ